MEEVLEELKNTNELLAKIIKQKDADDELLTVEDIHEEYGFGPNTIREMFKDPKLPVQRYLRPFRVKRKAFLEYLNESHDYISSTKE